MPAGLNYFDQLALLLERLHDDACQRDKAGSRELHFDQYCMLVLLYLFNPSRGRDGRLSVCAAIPGEAQTCIKPEE